MKKTMDCQSVNQRLDDYLDGQLSSQAQASFEVHIDGCAECARVLKHARAVIGGLATLPVEGPTPGFFDAALAKAAAQPDAVGHARTRGRSGWFAGALAAGLSALVVAGLLVLQPDPSPAPASLAHVELTILEPRTINLVFASGEALADVTLTVDLPAGVELVGHPARRQVRWTTQLAAGKNVLPLELIGVDGTGGELVATLRRDGKQKVFNINVNLLPG